MTTYEEDDWDLDDEEDWDTADDFPAMCPKCYSSDIRYADLTSECTFVCNDCKHEFD